VGKPEESRQLGRSRSKWKILKYIFQEVGWEEVGKIELAQDRDRWRPLVKAVMKLLGSINCGEVFD